MASRVVSTGGGSDANVFNANGIPAVALGIGYRHAYSTEEGIAISDLMKTTEFILATIHLAANKM